MQIRCNPDSRYRFPRCAPTPLREERTMARRLRAFSSARSCGKTTELQAFEGKLDNFNWILSHDGQYLAWPSEHTSSKQFGIRVFSLSGVLKRDIAVPGWSEIYGLDWAADSQSLWACTRDANGDSALLKIGLDGTVATLLSHVSPSLEWAVPSPDGRHLAIVRNSNRSNISLLETSKQKLFPVHPLGGQPQRNASR